MLNMSTTHTIPEKQKKQGGACCKATHDEVARAAFCLYEEHGSQGGQDVKNWLDAEAHVKEQHARTVHGVSSVGKASGPSAR